MINVTGQNVLNPSQRWSEGFKQNVVNSRVKTTESLAKAIVNTKADVFITISGVAYYKPDNAEYTEESICEEYDFLSGKRSVCAQQFRVIPRLLCFEIIILRARALPQMGSGRSTSAGQYY